MPFRKLVSVLGSAGSRYAAESCSQHAAGIAYRVLFSLAPLAIVLVSIFGLVLQDEELRDDAVSSIVSALPIDDSSTQDVESAIEDIATPSSAAGLVALLVLFWTASGMMGAIRRGLETAMGVDEGRPAVPGKLVDLALVAGAALLVLASVGIGLVTQFVNGLVGELADQLEVGGGVAQDAVSIVLPLLLWAATALLLYRFVPAAELRFRGALAGAVTTAALLLAISLAADLLYAKTTGWSVVYGSLTSLLVFLYSVYLYAIALLFGATVAVEWSAPRGPGGGLSRSAARGAIRRLFARPGRSSERAEHGDPGHPGHQGDPR